MVLGQWNLPGEHKGFTVVTVTMPTEMAREILHLIGDLPADYPQRTFDENAAEAAMFEMAANWVAAVLARRIAEGWE